MSETTPVSPLTTLTHQTVSHAFRNSLKYGSATLTASPFSSVIGMEVRTPEGIASIQTAYASAGRTFDAPPYRTSEFYKSWALINKGDAILDISIDKRPDFTLILFKPNTLSCNASNTSAAWLLELCAQAEYDTTKKEVVALMCKHLTRAEDTPVSHNSETGHVIPILTALHNSLSAQ